MGPIWIDDQRVLLGSLVDSPRKDRRLSTPTARRDRRARSRRISSAARCSATAGWPWAPSRATALAPRSPTPIWPAGPGSHGRQAEPAGQDHGQRRTARHRHQPQRHVRPRLGAAFRRRHLRIAGDDLAVENPQHPPRPTATPSAPARWITASKASTSISTASISTATPSACWARARWISNPTSN